jgi:hypothetical protein
VLRPLQRHITRCAQRGISATRHQMLQAAQVQAHDQQCDRAWWSLLCAEPPVRPSYSDLSMQCSFDPAFRLCTSCMMLRRLC